MLLRWVCTIFSLYGAINEPKQWPMSPVHLVSAVCVHHQSLSTYQFEAIEFLDSRTILRTTTTEVLKKTQECPECSECL